jgi:hypothetical protein
MPGTHRPVTRPKSLPTEKTVNWQTKHARANHTGTPETRIHWEIAPLH